MDAAIAEAIEAGYEQVDVGAGSPMNPGQLRAWKLMRGNQTNTCLVGGSRSGKTALITRAIISRGLRSPDSRHLFTRFRANALRASVWLDTLPKVLRMWFPGVKLESHRQDGFEQLPNGSQLWFGGLDAEDRVEKILGQEYATIYAGECSQIPYSSILTLRTRLAQVCPRLRLRAYYDLNPSSTLHWTNLEFGEHRDPITKTLLKNPEQFKRCFLNPEDNAANLAPEYMETLRNMPAAFRQRFYEGKYVLDVDGALWTIDRLELCREEPVQPEEGVPFQRVGVSVDPSGATSKFDIRSDEIGIVAAGLLHSDIAVVLEDATVRGSPETWASRAVAMYRKWKADFIVGEVNYGGDMVRAAIHAVDPNVPVITVHASRGKVARAEPVAALYEKQRVLHAGRFNELEEQMLMFTRYGYSGDRSPDRADALVWIISALMFPDESPSVAEFGVYGSAVH